MNLIDAARHADATFAETVLAADTDSRAALELFIDLGQLDQAVVVLFLARYAGNMLALAMAQVNEAPCFAQGCGHPRHLGACDLCGCEAA